MSLDLQLRETLSVKNDERSVLFNTTGSFHGSALDFSRFCNEQFEGVSSQRDVHLRLMGMISDWFGVEEASYITFRDERSDRIESPSFTTFPNICKLDSDVAASVCVSLGSANVKGVDKVRAGVFRIQVSGKEYCCAYFDSACGGQGLLIWLPSLVSRETKAALIIPELPSNGEILDHLVRGAQQASKWLRRLDSAQALLYQDEVTGLFNYRYLDVALDSEFRRLQRFHLPFSLLFIDLDNFKHVNDTHGHLTGSSILRQVGNQIKIAVRDVDVVIRYGGDEFVVVLIGTNSSQALLAAERVRSCVERHEYKAESSEDVIHLSTSIGVASCPEHGRDKFTIISLADQTMYVAKRSGKNRVVMVQSNSKLKNRDLTSTLQRGNQ